jgi:putative flippase GtrA
MKDWTTPLPGILGEIFTEGVMGKDHSNWGYILPFFLSNLIANTVGYFLNKHKTFKSDAPIWHYFIYIVFLFLLIVFTTWIQGLVANLLIGVGLESLGPTVAAMAAGTIQMILLFPIQKFVLLREKKIKVEESEKNK